MSSCCRRYPPTYNDPRVPDPRDTSFTAAIDYLPSAAGKTIAITGASTGMGLWLACAAVRKRAACVILLNRPSESATEAYCALTELAQDYGTQVHAVPLDLASLNSVRVAAVSVLMKGLL